MTIYLIAKDLLWADLDLALDQYDSVIDMGYNGYYSLSHDKENGKYELTLSLEFDSMISEVRKLRKILRNYITDFECIGNVVTSLKPTVTEDNSNDEPTVGLSTLEEQPTVTDSFTGMSAEVLFKDISVKNIDERVSTTIKTLFTGSLSHKKTLAAFIDYTTVYIKAEEKPKSFNALCVMANKKVAPATLKKVNLVIQQKFGLNTFMEFLKSIPNLAEEEAVESEPEEVILEKPKKPPKNSLSVSINKEDIISEKMKNLDYFIKHIPKNTTISEKVKLLLEKMGILSFKNNNRDFLKKLFCSVLLFKKVNIEKLFNCDTTLKRFATISEAESILKEFLERFFKTSITHEDEENFFEELIFKFFGKTENTHISPTPIVKKQYNNQDSSIFKCFPKHDKFDNFIKGVYSSKGSRQLKVKRILGYMGIKKLSDAEIKIIEKLCLKQLYMFDFYKPEQNYTEEEKTVLERFVNNFAKTLSENANYIFIKDFIYELSKIPVL